MKKIPIRHRIVWTLLRPLVCVFLYIKFGYRCKVAKNLPDQYIVLSNHNTDFDPIFVGVSFRKPMYFVSSEHISRWKLAYPLLKWGFQPILRYKGTSAASTVMEMLRAIRKGGNICMFPEGARSWNGITAPILPSTGKLVKSAKCALVTYKISGGYFVSPNWSEGGTRRGRISADVVNIYTAEMLSKMSVDEINHVINQDLYEDAYAQQLAAPAAYKGKQTAFRMENMLSHCPNCRAMDQLSSKKDTVICQKCGKQFKYTKFAMLEGLDKQTVKDLFDWQKQQVLDDAGKNITYTTETATLYTVTNHQQTHLATGSVRMDRDSIQCEDFSVALVNITDMAMHGRHALVFSVGEEYYELIFAANENALKFHLLFQAHTDGRITKYN